MLFVKNLFTKIWEDAVPGMEPLPYWWEMSVLSLCNLNAHNLNFYVLITELSRTLLDV